MTSVLPLPSSAALPPPHLLSAPVQTRRSPTLRPTAAPTNATAAVAAAPPPHAHLMPRPNLLRGASMPNKPPIGPSSGSKASRPVRAVVSVAPSVSSSATAAHVLQDVADVELSKMLQSRLATLGIGANMVKAEVRANTAHECGGTTATATASDQRTFTLTLSGRLAISLGSLFNILIHGFLQQHPQISVVERRITFGAAPGANATASAKAASRQSEAAPERCVDSAPILALKVAHLAKLMQSSKACVVYTGDHLLTDTAPGPHPPTVLARWVRNGNIRHIINESTDGFFNPGSAGAASSTAISMHMSDSDDSCSVSSTESDDVDAALGPDHLSELFGNKKKEECTAAHCDGNEAGNGPTTYFRDFEVRQARFAATQIGGLQPDSTKATDLHLTGRSCTHCQAPLRDTLVDWSENLPRAILQRSVTQAAAADLSLVLGSTMRVAPTCDMPQLSSTSHGGVPAPMVIVSAFATAKDVEALETGGILVRKEVSAVLLALERHRRKQQRSARPVQATVVRKSSRNQSAAGADANNAAARATPAIAVSPVRENGTGTVPTGSPPRRLGALERTWTKSSHGHPPRSISSRRHTVADTLLSGLPRPGLTRAATACSSLLSRRAMPLSAKLPPFPRLDDDQAGDSDDAEKPPAASAPSRASSEIPTPAQFALLALEANRHQQQLRHQTASDGQDTPSLIGEGHLFPPSAPSSHSSTFPPPLSDSLLLPHLPTVSSPVFLTSRNSSLAMWNFGIATPLGQDGAQVTDAEDVRMQ